MHTCVGGCCYWFAVDDNNCGAVGIVVSSPVRLSSVRLSILIIHLHMFFCPKKNNKQRKNDFHIFPPCYAKLEIILSNATCAFSSVILLPVLLVSMDYAPTSRLILLIVGFHS
jgi:hypothetical protein